MSQYDTLEQKAVALKYDETQNSAPVIVASGMGYVAEKIVEIANDNGIPVYEDNSLATVLAQMKLGKEIPPELYQTIVDIYAYVYMEESFFALYTSSMNNSRFIT